MSKIPEGEPIATLPPVEEVEGDDVPALAEEETEEMPEVTFFTHLDECMAAVESLSEVTPMDYTTQASREHAIVFERFEAHLDVYLEAPQVVRPHLEKLVPPLVAALRQRMPTYEQLGEILQKTAPNTSKPANDDGTAATAKNSTGEVLHAIFDEYDTDAPKTALHHFSRLLYCVAKVAGNTNVTGHFPHEVMSMETVFHCLQAWQQDSTRKREWEVRYCMLLWLSNLILAPFALGTLDSSVGGDVPLSRRMLHCAQEFLGDSSKCREGAALFVGRMMTRPDALNLREEFFTFAARATASFEAEQWTLAGGTLLALATTLKLGKREEMIGMACQLIPLISPVALSFPDATVCQTAVKTVQRLGLVCMPPKAASWRYKRNIADLELNLNGIVKEETVKQAEADISQDEEEVPEVIEVVLDVLLRALCHQDTIVRWSAAKGIGQICERLPRVAMEDVLQAVMTEFASRENDSGWHGACLALAEMAKRSTLLPASLAPVIDIVERGLQYDVSRGSYSVGAHVRDASCYVCWSLARAYEVEDLSQWVVKIASSLVVSSVFDREVNVRRASSAAFQECVGRLGNFPDGISLVTIMDFFALGTLRHAFLDIAPKVAAFKTYLMPLADHLVKTKFWHWDRNIRVLAAQAFGKLIPLFSPEQLEEVVVNGYLKTLLTKATNMSIPIRHGALSALTECVLVMPQDYLETSSFVEQLLTVMGTLHSKRLFRGRGGEWIRQVGCRLVKALSVRRCKLPETVAVANIRETKKVPTVQFLEEFLEECWKQPLEWLQTESAEAYFVFTRQYYQPTAAAGEATAPTLPLARLNIIRRIISGTEEGKVHNERRGCLLVLGALPPALLKVAEEEHQLWSKACTASVKCTKLESTADTQDAESRRNATKTMVQLYLEDKKHLEDPAVLTTSSSSASSSEGGVITAKTVFAALNNAMLDYAVDKRGDVGSMVRTEAMAGYQNIYRAILTSQIVSAASAEQLTNIQELTPEFLAEFLSAVVKQATEKIDRMRGVAGGHLLEFLKLVEAVTSSNGALATLLPAAIPHYDALCKVKAAKVVDWSSPHESFEALVPPLIDTATFRNCLLEGLVLSVGGMSSHVAKASLPVMTHCFKASNEAAASSSSPRVCSSLSQALCEVGQKNAHSERVVPPFYTTVNKLLVAGAIDPLAAPELCTLVEKESKHFAKDVQRVLPLVPALASLTTVTTCRSQAWKLCLSMVASRFPKVRAQIGNELYTSLMMCMGEEEANSESREGGEVNLEEAMEILASTQWDGTDATMIRNHRDQLYPLLGLTKPVGSGAAQAPIVITRKEDTSYKALVREAGY